MAQPDAFPMFLVEDSDDDLFLFRRLLAKAELSHPLHVSTNGQAAIDRLNEIIQAGESVPGLLFIDLKLPLRSGFEVLDWAIRQPALRDCVKLVLSSSAEARDVKRAFELGANGYLVKYPSPAVFREIVRLVELIRSGVPAATLTFPGMPRP